MARRSRSVFAPVLIGVVGTAILLALCAWQIQRLAWKEGLIEQLAARLAADPVSLVSAPDPASDEFTRITVQGRFDEADGAHGFPDAPFLTTYERLGAGYRIIQPFTLTDGRRVMIDRGFVPAELKNRDGAAAQSTPALEGEISLTGALRWPNEIADPPFGVGDNVWIARDLDRMAQIFSTETVLLVAETSTAVDGARWPRPTPLTVNISNNHENYAITWGLLALVWSVMAVVWMRSIRCQS